MSEAMLVEAFRKGVEQLLRQAGVRIPERRTSARRPTRKSSKAKAKPHRSRKSSRSTKRSRRR